MKLIYGMIIVVIAQIIAFFQLQGQSKWIWAKDNPFILMFLGLPISFLYIKSTGLINDYTGQTWPGRLIGQSIGVIIFALFSSYGVVLKTTNGTSDNMVLLIALAKLTFTPLNVNSIVSYSIESDFLELSSTNGFILFNNNIYLILN